MIRKHLTDNRCRLSDKVSEFDALCRGNTLSHFIQRPNGCHCGMKSSDNGHQASEVIPACGAEAASFLVFKKLHNSLQGHHRVRQVVIDCPLQATQNPFGSGSACGHLSRYTQLLSLPGLQRNSITSTLAHVPRLMFDLERKYGHQRKKPATTHCRLKELVDVAAMGCCQALIIRFFLSGRGLDAGDVAARRRPHALPQAAASSPAFSAA